MNECDVYEPVVFHTIRQRLQHACKWNHNECKDLLGTNCLLEVIVIIASHFARVVVVKVLGQECLEFLFGALCKALPETMRYMKIEIGDEFVYTSSL